MDTLSAADSPSFVWGVSGHNRTYAAYPEKNLEQQIRLAAELGSHVYRLNFTPMREEDYLYLDRVLELCDANGLSLFLITEDRRFTEEDAPGALRERAAALAARYKGRIPCYQVSNEQDNCCLCEDSCGEERRNYDLEYTRWVAVCMKAIADGIRSSDPQARISVNVSYKHTYFMQLLLEEGMSWDVSGVDWYSNMGDPSPTIGNLLTFPAQDIIVAEGNTWGGSMEASAQEQEDYLFRTMDWFRTHPCKRIRAYMIYELLDEPLLEGGEAHFGLVTNDVEGNIGEPKPIYRAVQSLWRQDMVPGAISNS